MRNHGWEVPYHPLQTVALAVFAGLSLSYYVFYIPFVGNNVLKLHIYAVFSPVVLAVSILYVRCAGCDPADPGVHQSNRAEKTQQQKMLKSMDLVSLPHLDTPAHDDSASRKIPSRSICGRWMICLPFACCKKGDSTKLNVGELLLYCSICEAKISRNSKHCKACDKCVHEFDHHCRWLNNCVGKRNYKTFVSLMVTCLLLLIMVWSTGIGVLVRCFTQKAKFEKEILHILGSSFSRVPYIVIVFVMSLLALLATIPLCQLFFFHLILIHKGITTYDYIVATREQGLERDIIEGEGFNSLTSSPASCSSTGISGYSPGAGGALTPQRVFCTPPRMFVEHQQVIAFSGDLESTTPAAKTSSTKGAPKAPHKKTSVGLNLWKLARLNIAAEADVAAHAEEASSIAVSSRTEDSHLERSPSNEISKLRKQELESSLGVLRLNSSITTPGASPTTGSFVNGDSPPPYFVLPLPMNFKCSPSRLSGEMSSCPRSSYQSCSPEMLIGHGSPDELPSTVVSPALERTSVVGNNKDSNGKFCKWVGMSSESSSTETSGDENGGERRTLKKRNHDSNVATPNSGCTESSSGSRAEAHILRHVTKEWPGLRHTLSVSPDDSPGSFPSPFYTPMQEPNATGSPPVPR